MRQIKVENSIVTILPAVKGLVSDSEKVVNAVERVSPDVIAVSISKEELAGLKDMEPTDEIELNDIEIVYAAMLEEFGEVATPSPYLVSALNVAVSHDIPILPIDMNDEVYTESYCRNVKTMEMLKESRRAKGLLRKRSKFDFSSPEAFAISWDAVVNKKGFRALETEREAHMASVIKALCRTYDNILAVIEVERADAVISHLNEDSCAECQELSDVIDIDKEIKETV